MSANPFDPNNPFDDGDAQPNNEGVRPDDESGASTVHNDPTPRFGFGTPNEPAQQDYYGAPYGGHPPQQGYGVPYGGQPAYGTPFGGYPYEPHSAYPTYNNVEAWKKAVLTPSLQGYQALLADPRATIDRAYAWLVGSFFVGTLLFIIAAVIGQLAEQVTGNDDNVTVYYSSGNETMVESPLVTVIYGLLCALPLTIILGSILVTMMMAIIHILARIFGGQANFDKTAYAVSLFISPMFLMLSAYSLLLSPFSFFDSPLVSILITVLNVVVLLVLAVYALYVMTIGTKAVHGIGWGESFIATIAPLGTIFVCCFACVFVTIVPFLVGP